jgi:hypothetical protein
MASQRCDGCGSKVRIGGGIGDFWTFATESSGGIDLELADGTDHFLCFDCIERLPDDHDVTAEDVAALSVENDHDPSVDDDPDPSAEDDSDGPDDEQ